MLCLFVDIPLHEGYDTWVIIVWPAYHQIPPRHSSHNVDYLLHVVCTEVPL
jgi:hypothetical protein